MDSILVSIKKLLGIGKEYTAFDDDLIIHINSAFNVLSQIGVVSAKGFTISDEKSKWEDLLNDSKDLEIVKSYIYLKTKLIFDPPGSSIAVDAIKQQISELEWRINSEVDYKENYDD